MVPIAVVSLIQDPRQLSSLMYRKSILSTHEQSEDEQTRHRQMNIDLVQENRALDIFLIQ